MPYTDPDPGILAHYWERDSTPDDIQPHAQESEPDPIYQTLPPNPASIDAWQVGDLVRQRGQLILIIAVGQERQHQTPDESGDWMVVTTFRELICLDATGNVWKADGPTSRINFLHNTGLTYNYQYREQVQRDFRAGYFTPYFEIL